MGRAIAIAFASTGAKVHVCDIDTAIVDELRARIAGITESAGGQLVAFWRTARRMKSPRLLQTPEGNFAHHGTKVQ
jgi:hypothetical protein